MNEGMDVNSKQVYADDDPSQKVASNGTSKHVSNENRKTNADPAINVENDEANVQISKGIEIS